MQIGPLIKQTEQQVRTDSAYEGAWRVCGGVRGVCVSACEGKVEAKRELLGPGSDGGKSESPQVRMAPPQPGRTISFISVCSVIPAAEHHICHRRFSFGVLSSTQP